MPTQIGPGGHGVVGYRLMSLRTREYMGLATFLPQASIHPTSGWGCQAAPPGVHAESAPFPLQSLPPPPSLGSVRGWGSRLGRRHWSPLSRKVHGSPARANMWREVAAGRPQSLCPEDEPGAGCLVGRPKPPGHWARGSPVLARLGVLDPQSSPPGCSSGPSITSCPGPAESPICHEMNPHIHLAWAGPGGVWHQGWGLSLDDGS